MFTHRLHQEALIVRQIILDRRQAAQHTRHLPEVLVHQALAHRVLGHHRDQAEVVLVLQAEDASQI